MRSGDAGAPGAAVAKVDALWPLRGMSSGWQADLALRFARTRDRTALAERRHRGPLLVQRPFYPEGDEVCHTYLIHPPAGIVGGDDLNMAFDLEPGAHGLVTTPSATRWYYSRGAAARIRQHAKLRGGATLEWLPQENLLFDGAIAHLTTRIELCGDARFCGWEILGLGRPARGESFDGGRLDFRFELFRDRQPLLLERLHGGPGGLPGLGGHTSCATFLATGADTSALAAARQALDDAADSVCAATLLGDVLVARGVAAHCEPLRRAFTRLWSALRPPLLGRVAALPRIWHT